jgi:murein hydrolase activator
MRMLLLLAIMLFAAGAGAAPQRTVKQYSSEIENTTQSLKELQKALKEKRVEKEQCLLEEKGIRKELGRIEQELSRLQKQAEKLRKDIRAAEKNLNSAGRELKRAGWEKDQWHYAINRELDLWFRAQYSHGRLYTDYLDDRMRIDALDQKKTLLANAQKREVSSQESMQKWEKAEQRLKELKTEKDSMAREQSKVKEQKKDILKSTVGRRVAAEEEIKKITESARALQQLIIDLERAKKNREDEAAERKRLQGKKKAFPWPVAGQVASRFGKCKHPELDTYVINNGIKITASPGAEVKAVDKGEVIFSGTFRSYGLMVIIDHGGGIYTIYGSIGDILVDEEQKVSEGEVVGKLPATGQPLLYFEVRQDGQPEDPLLWLK